MLYKSGVNLESSAIKFIENNENITLFSAYLKLEELKSLNHSKKIKRIIVRWEIRDLCLKVSDIELYEYCLEHNITLFRNTRIHLKAFWNNSKSVFFGSANVTGRGIGEKGHYNYELNGSNSDLNYEDITYFNKIILNSEYVSESLFQEIGQLLEQIKTVEIIYPEIQTKKSISDYFLISNLPMTDSVEQLFEGYCNTEELNDTQINYVAHDIALYHIPKDLNKIEFYHHVKVAFNFHPFILELKDHIKLSQRQSLNYGSVIKWIQENTTTVPIPRAWDLKQEVIVNVLYNWICELDKDFYWNVPNHSQVIYYDDK